MKDSPEPKIGVPITSKLTIATLICYCFFYSLTLNANDELSLRNLGEVEEIDSEKKSISEDLADRVTEEENLPEKQTSPEVGIVYETSRTLKQSDFIENKEVIAVKEKKRFQFLVSVK